MFFDKPITGWGVLGTLVYGHKLIPEYGRMIIHPHNLWLTFLTGTGVVGLSIYLYMKFNLFKSMIKLYYRNEPLLPLLVALNIMVIIQGLIDCTLYAPQLGIQFIAIGAIVNNLEIGKIKSKSNNVNRVDVKSVIKQRVV
jgi:O-antigen ligase